MAGLGLAVGDVVAGKYRLASVIGEGGMGTVFAAHHELLDAPVALKVLSSDMTRNRAVIDRFLREARAVARLKSEHVVRVMDVGTLDSGQPYIVMELLEGEDLERRIQRLGKLPVPEAADCILQALEAMSHAHAAGIVHRDLKPANLFVATTPDGREIVKVLDFGIAKLTSVVMQGPARTGALTGEHTMLGSPSYMSPEQVRDSSIIDHRTDLWALGVILYEISTGHEPFPGNSVGEIFGEILHAAPEPIAKHCPEAPPELQAVIDRCLARDREMRFPDVAAMARALAPLGSGAWEGHAARMEQTLARARSASDPGSTGARFSLSGEPTRPRTPTSSSPGPSSMSVAFSHTRRASARNTETLSEAGRDEADALPARRSHGKLAAMGLLFGAAVAAAGALAIPRLRPHASEDQASRRLLLEASSPSGEPAHLAPSAVLTTASPVPLPSVAPAPLSAAPAGSSAHSPALPASADRASGADAAVPHSGKTRRNSAPAGPAKPREASSAGLPGVLESPD